MISQVKDRFELRVEETPVLECTQGLRGLN
jgi:hypothetical protein